MSARLFPPGRTLALLWAALFRTQVYSHSFDYIFASALSTSSLQLSVAHSESFATARVIFKYPLIQFSTGYFAERRLAFDYSRVGTLISHEARATPFSRLLKVAERDRVNGHGFNERAKLDSKSRN